MTEISDKRKELEDRAELPTYKKYDYWTRKRKLARWKIMKGEWKAELKGFNLGVSLAQKEFLDLIDKAECKGETHGFRPKWIDAEELKKAVTK